MLIGISVMRQRHLASRPPHGHNSWTVLWITHQERVGSKMGFGLVQTQLARSPKPASRGLLLRAQKMGGLGAGTVPMPAGSLSQIGTATGQMKFFALAFRCGITFLFIDCLFWVYLKKKG